MAGRMLSMPLAFLVPVILTRRLSVDDFGCYKQIFLVFNVILPVIDLGITNSLYYLMPRYAELKNAIVWQTLVVQAGLAFLVVCCFAWSPDAIAKLFTNDVLIGGYIPLLGVFAVAWHLSSMLEIVLVVEKKAFEAGVVTFLSESGRSVAVIGAVLGGGGLRGLLLALVGVAVVRLAFMAVYVVREYELRLQAVEPALLQKQLKYALPFGVAVIVSGLVGNVHQYIVSFFAEASYFAIFSIGCFQLPLLGIAIDSIAKTSLVRMSELRSQPNAHREIAQVVSNSCRKLWLLFFPAFVFLFLAAEEFITILFSAKYIESVPVFRVFIFMIPLAAIMLQHVLRAFAETRFILFNNLLVFFSSLVLCLLGWKFFGAVGVAAGFVLAQLNWKAVFLLRCKKVLHVASGQLIPYRILLRSAVIFSGIGLLAFMVKRVAGANLYLAFSASLGAFGIMSVYAYWYADLLADNEKSQLLASFGKVKSLFPGGG